MSPTERGLNQSRPSYSTEEDGTNEMCAMNRKINRLSLFSLYCSTIHKIVYAAVGGLTKKLQAF